MRPESLWLKVLRALPLLLALSAGSAQAAVYTGVWDPAFGAPFTNLGWRGNADFFVPDSCTPEGTVDVANAPSCGGQARVTLAQVEFYDLRSTAPHPDTIATLAFDPESLVIGTLRYVDGALTQLSTNLSNAVLPLGSLADYVVSPSTSFMLQFSLEGPRLAYQTCPPTNGGCVFGGFNDGAAFPPLFTITRVSSAVPEPTTAWLGGLALLSLLALRQRKSARR